MGGRKTKRWTTGRFHDGHPDVTPMSVVLLAGWRVQLRCVLPAYLSKLVALRVATPVVDALLLALC